MVIYRHLVSMRFYVALAIACLSGCGIIVDADTTNKLLGSESQSSDSINNARSGGVWTTLGTRSFVASSSRAITSKSDGKWVDYNPASVYPNLNTTLSTIVMPDGTQISAAITLPADASGKSVTQALPTIVSLNGYNKNAPNNSGVNAYFVSHGYAQVIVDVRGTGGSQGQWKAFDATEQGDYRPILDWIAAQTFCNGSIGLYGESLLAIHAVLAEAKGHPAVKAAFLIVPMADGYRDIVFTGGQANVGFIPLWLTLVTAYSAENPEILQDPAMGAQLQINQLTNALIGFQGPFFLNTLIGDSNVAYDGDFWNIRSPIEQAHNIHVPTFIVGGLQDIFQRGEPLLYEAIKQNAPAKLLIGPWVHSNVGGDLPVDGVPIIDHITLQWFDRYLDGKDNGADRLPNVTQYVYGLGHYVSTIDWPHPSASAQRIYLHGDKSLSNTEPKADEATNAILQEPLNGICSASAAQWTAGVIGIVPLPCFNDDTVAEAFDVHYETLPLTHDLYLNGPINVDVWVSTTGSEGGVSVRVDDVDGNTVLPLTNGLQTLSMSAVDGTRSRMLDSQIIQPWHVFTQAAQMAVTPNVPMKVSVEVFPTSALIKAGHKLRVSIGSSDFPHGLPPIPSLLSGAAGVLTIYSDAKHVSSVLLPAVPTSLLPLTRDEK